VFSGFVDTEGVRGGCAFEVDTIAPGGTVEFSGVELDFEGCRREI
jgi:hypothetical protein